MITLVGFFVKKERYMGKCISLFFFLLTIPAAFAGGEISGGGNAVVCFETKEQAAKVKKQNGSVLNEDLPGIHSIKLLELHHLQELIDSGLDVEIMSAGASETASQILERIFKFYPLPRYVSPEERPVVRESYEQLIKNVQFVGTPLHRAYDSREIENYDIDEKCALTTMAFQRNGDLTIDRRLFTHARHSNLSKALLYLHEALYYIALQRGYSDSLSTQKLLKILISRRDNITPENWLKEARKLDFTPRPYHPGVINNVFPPEFPVTKLKFKNESIYSNTFLQGVEKILKDSFFTVEEQPGLYDSIEATNALLQEIPVMLYYFDLQNNKIVYQKMDWRISCSYMGEWNAKVYTTSQLPGDSIQSPLRNLMSYITPVYAGGKYEGGCLRLLQDISMNRLRYSDKANPGYDVFLDLNDAKKAKVQLLISIMKDLEKQRADFLTDVRKKMTPILQKSESTNNEFFNEKLLLEIERIKSQGIISAKERDAIVRSHNIYSWSGLFAALADGALKNPNGFLLDFLPEITGNWVESIMQIDWERNDPMPLP